MPIETMLYLSRGMFRITEAAEIRETSCSDEQPPNRTATVVFSILFSLRNQRISLVELSKFILT
jgi:hypothetical protein